MNSAMNDVCVIIEKVLEVESCVMYTCKYLNDIIDCLFQSCKNFTILLCRKQNKFLVLFTHAPVQLTALDGSLRYVCKIMYESPS